jgi:hypothetical protein
VDLQWKKRGAPLLFRAPPIRGRDPPTSCRRYCPRYPGSARDNQPVMRRRPHPGAGTANTIGVASLDARSSPCNGRLSLSGSIEPIIMRALPFIKLPTEDRLESRTVEIVHGNSEMNHSGITLLFAKCRFMMRLGRSSHHLYIVAR